MHLTRAISLLRGVPVAAEEVEAFRDPGKDERELEQWARGYPRWHASLPAKNLPHGGEEAPSL